MYNVSNDYLTALATDPLHTSVQLRFWIGGSLAFTMHDRNIVPNSLTIQKQCMNNDGFGVGGVYAGELNVTLVPDDNFDLFDYDVANAEIRVIYRMGLRYENGAWVYEDIPLGRFLVDDIDLKGSGTYQITAYDKMILFSDGDIDEVIRGDAYSVIFGLCDLVGVDLSTTENQFENFINSALTYRIKPKWVDNARDALAYVCACIGCFATMGRTGDLEIRPLTLDYSEYDDSISKSERLSSFAAMGKTRVRRVRGNFVTTVTNEAGEEKKEFVKYKANTGRAHGGILDLGDNPVQWDDMQEVVDNLADELYAVNYTAATFTTISNPIYDLGDRLQVTHPDSGKTVITLLTAIEWKYHGIQTHRGAGNDKGVQTSSVKNQSSSNSVTAENNTVTDPNSQRYIFAQENAGGIADGETREILSFEFNVKKTSAIVAMYTTIGFEVETTVSSNDYKDCELTVTIALDGVTVKTLEQTYGDGNQVLTIVYKLDELTVGDHELSVAFAPVGGLIR